jgi:hypothetical protein
MLYCLKAIRQENLYDFLNPGFLSVFKTVQEVFKL